MRFAWILTIKSLFLNSDWVKSSDALYPLQYILFQVPSLAECTKQQEEEMCGDLMGAEGFFFFSLLPPFLKIQIECNFQLI